MGSSLGRPDGVRATKISETQRGYLDLDTHLALCTFRRIVANKARGWRVTLEVAVHYWGGERGARRRHRLMDVPEPWQAPA